MIARSDLVILAISGTLLVTGIYRWQGSLQPVARSPVTTVSPARQSNVNAQVRVEPPPPARLPVTISASSADRQTELTTTAPPLNPARTDEPSPVEAAPSSAGNEVVAAGAEPAVRKRELYGTYIVQPGDNLTYIAGIHGTSVDTLRSINGIEGSMIYIDQELLYPLPAN